MNESQYLESASVREFVAWVTPRLCAPGTPHHVGAEWPLESLFDAYQRYTWGGLDFEENQRQLTPLSARLRTALQDGDPTAFVKAGHDVLEWGRVLNDNDERLRSCEDVIRVFRAARTQLEPTTADTDHIDQVRYMNSGFTKIYALLIDRFPIYDSRVSTAIAYLVGEFLTENNRAEIPRELDFACGGERRSKTNPYKRSVSRNGLHFHGMGSGHPNHRRTRSNLMAAWLLRTLSDIACFGQLDPHRRVRAIEAALFMVGEEIPPA